MPDPQNPAAEDSPAVDARQDELMTVESSDGRPPPKRLRMAEWSWFVIGAVVIVVATTIWIVARGISLEAVLAGIVGVAIVVGVNPAVWAGLKRGREERAARKQAQVEQKVLDR
jgi:hypothetical protein